MPEDLHVSRYHVLAGRIRGQQHDLPDGPLPVLMDDPILHTPLTPYCHDPSCPCQEARRHVAPLNGNRRFQLMR
jgi:hypothetical protein